MLHLRFTSLPFALSLVTIAGPMARNVFSQNAVGPSGQIASVTISPGVTGDDTARIQHAIDTTTGTLRFEDGVYKLSRSIHLRSNRT